MQYAVGILGTEAYHSGAIRTKLKQVEGASVFPYGVRVGTIISAISTLRASVGSGKDNGLGRLVPADQNSLIFQRTAREILNIAYLGGMTRGGFFPEGVNGPIKN